MNTITAYYILNSTGLTIRQAILGTPSNEGPTIPDMPNVVLTDILEGGEPNPYQNFVETKSLEFPSPTVDYKLIPESDSMLLTWKMPYHMQYNPDAFIVYVYSCVDTTWREVAYFPNHSHLIGCLITGFSVPEWYTFGVRGVYVDGCILGEIGITDEDIIWI